ncbi:hypothetical protein VPNG_07011 [Cytospora leucostoma]|uniref:BZIP domain-containing protein n=1 Tax=Cytospora leucostoma TaxID=1230097 RepID=A0A423WN44_9PEZI|nr:hypothetical protein VPNG_07011 [Cytospora leucostoma]
MAPKQKTFELIPDPIGFPGPDEQAAATETETVTEAGSDSDTDSGDTHAAAGEEEASEKENLDPDDDQGDRPAKKRRVTQPNIKLLDRMIHIPSQRSVSAVARVAQELGVESPSRASSVDIDDPATETMLEDQLIADVELASSKSMTNSSPIRERHAKDAASMIVPAQKSKYVASTTLYQAPPLPPNQPTRQQGPQHFVPPINNRPQEPKAANPGHGRGHHGGGIFKKPGSPFVHRPQEKIINRPLTTGLPSAPPNFRVPAAPQTPTFARPKFLPRHVKVPSRVPVQASPTYAGSRRLAVEAANAFPTSTQLLVLNHADELFPSASQVAEELFEDQQSTPKAGAITRPPPKVQESPKSSVKTVAAPRPGPRPNERILSTSLQGNQPRNFAGDVPLDFPFLSTQDFVLSSQDLMELETPSKVLDGQKPQTRPVAEGNSAATRCRGFHASGQHVTELQDPIASNPPAMSPTTSHGKGHDLDERRSPSVEGEATVNQPNEGRRQSRDTSNSLDVKFPNQHCEHQPLHKNAVAKLTPVIKRTVRDGRVNGTSDQAHVRIVTPKKSPPKKRMFGSSGPGAEVLIAMERSYKQSLQDQRRREEELREQEKNRRRETEQLARELADMIDCDDGASDGLLGEDTGPRQPTPPGVGAAEDMGHTANKKPHETTEVTASQETDYGDFDFDAGYELDPALIEALPDSTNLIPDFFIDTSSHINTHLQPPAHSQPHMNTPPYALPTHSTGSQSPAPSPTDSSPRTGESRASGAGRQPPKPQEDPDTVLKRQRNTIAARKYRQKRLDRVKELEDALESMTQERDDLRLRLARQEAETAALREMMKMKSGQDSGSH